MASTYVNDLRLNEMATGDASGTWGTVTNTNLELIAEAFSYGTENMGSDANTTVTVADGASDEARSLYLKVTSTSLSADREVTLAPNTLSKVWIIENATTGGKAITIKQGTGATIDIPNGDVKMVATDGAGAGAAVYDLMVDLNIATKLTIKNPSTSDDTPATLLLQTGDTDIAADDKLGVINFQAPDEGAGTDAILVAAGIEAISEGDFSSSNNATKLSFKTGASEAAAEKMSISSVGNVTMKQTATGDDTPMTLLLQTGETDIAADDKLGVINFQAPDEGTGTDAILVAAGIEAVSEGDFSSSSNATKLSFKTGASEAATEKMAISSVGNVTMKQTATGDDTPMTLLLQTGETDIAAADVLGTIQFQAPDEGTGTDAVLVAAEVAAISEGDFSSSSNATSVAFKTGESEAATEKVRITSNGKILANTTSNAAGVVHELRTPTAFDDGKWATKFVGTSTNTDGTGPYGIWINYPNATPDNNSTNDFFFASDATAARFIIISSGDFWSSDGGWVDSDETLKENIADASNKLADVEKLKVRNFNWKSSYHPDMADKKMIGFVAQELAAVFPGLVADHDINPEGKDGTPNMKKGIKTSALVPILTKALQELSAKVTALEARVTTLEG